MHVVLFSPQIPQNTGSIARTCAATKTHLHLIRPYPFEITERNVRRAGLDYWPLVQLTEHESWERFVGSETPSRCWFIETSGETPYWSASFESNDYLVFGSETKGFERGFLDQWDPARILRIPMYQEGIRSLNLSNAVSIVLYEAIRQSSAN